jgi:hypothetical protein
MRHGTLVLLLALAPAVVTAQERLPVPPLPPGSWPASACGPGAACDAGPAVPPDEACPCDACCRRRIIVVKKRPPGGGEERGPVYENAPVNPGAFVAPPQAGRVYGTSRGHEIRGLRIRFPEFSIGLPSIELPCLRAFRDDSHMRTQGGIAPYRSFPAQAARTTVAAGPARNEYGRVRRGDEPEERGPAPDEKGDERAPDVECLRQETARCEARIDELRQCEQRIEHQLLEMRRLLEQIHGQPGTPPACVPGYPPGRAGVGRRPAAAAADSSSVRQASHDTSHTEPYASPAAVSGGQRLHRLPPAPDYRSPASKSIFSAQSE